MTIDKIETITVRAPSELLAALRQLAELQDRSLNAQIVRILRREIEGEQEQAGK